MILTYDIPKDIVKKYKGRMMGWLPDGRLAVASGARSRDSIPLGKHGINPTMVHCICGKPDDTIILPGMTHAVDVKTGEAQHNIELPMYLTALVLCQDCETKRLQAMAARVMCKCGKQVAWLEAGKTKEGKVITAGTDLHVEKCPDCCPGTTHLAIVELA